MKYHKIHSVYKRDDKGRFTTELSQPEFVYLFNNIWVWTEKIDGTNIRVIYTDSKVEFRGRTDRASLHPDLVKKLSELFKDGMFDNAILYGEGVGKKIQGGLYGDYDFILFDVWIGMWLERESVEEIAREHNLKIVPIVMKGTISEAEELVKKGFKSAFVDIQAEGLVGRPAVELNNRRGNRIITKLKTRDYVHR